MGRQHMVLNGLRQVTSWTCGERGSKRPRIADCALIPGSGRDGRRNAVTPRYRRKSKDTGVDRKQRPGTERIARDRGRIKRSKVCALAWNRGWFSDKSEKFMNAVSNDVSHTKCSPRQLEELRKLMEIFWEMFQGLTPEQRDLFKTNSLADAERLGIPCAA